MKIAKRLLTFLLCLSMLAQYCIPAYAAGGEANISAEITATEAKVGDTITLTISNCDMTAAAIKAGFYFDNTKLQVNKITWSNITAYSEDEEDDLDNAPVSKTTKKKANQDGSALGVYAINNGVDSECYEGTIVTVIFDVIAGGEAEIILREETGGTDAFMSDDVETIVVTISDPAAASRNLYIDGVKQEDCDFATVEELNTYLDANIPTAAAGMKFAGWKFYSDADNKTEVTLGTEMPEHDLYAVSTWEEIIPEYKLTFLDEKGNVLSGPFTYKKGEAVTATYPVYNKPNYTITWSDPIPETLTGDLEIGAIATPNVYTVNFINCGSEVSDDVANAGNNWTVEAIGAQTKDPDANGHYNFLGWATSADATSAQYAAGAQIPVTGTTNLYAVYQTNVHTDAAGDQNHTCDGCSWGTAVSGHTPASDDGDCTTAILCTECGAVTTAAKTHVDGDDKNHVCDNEGCNVDNVDGGHAGGTATCMAQAVCAECGQSYGVVDEDKHVGQLKYTDNKNGTHSAAYDVCGHASVTNESHTYIKGECVCGALDKSVELPEIEITDIKDTLTGEDPDLTFALNFAIKDPDSLDQDYIDTLFNVYGDYFTDYVLTISGLSQDSVTFNNDGSVDGYLAGQYDDYSTAWLTVPFGNEPKDYVTVQNGESLYIMEYAAKLMNKTGLRFTLAEVAAIVQNFDCGVYFTPEFLAANPNLKVDLELKVFTEDEQGNKIDDISVAINHFDLADKAAAVSGAGKQTKYYASLTDAYNAAEDGDTISLLKDAVLTNKQPVAKKITIDGCGHSITANHSYYILEASSDCTIKNITLDTNNKAKGVKVASGNVVLDNVTIENHSTDWNAIEVTGGNLTFKTYLKVDTTVGIIDASKAQSVMVEEDTVFDLTKWSGLASPAKCDLKNAEDVNGNPFFCAYNSTTYYATLNSITSINKLTLLKDATLSTNVTIYGNESINLNGHDLTIADGKTVKVSGSLTINGNGTITGEIVLTKSTATLTAPAGLTVKSGVTGYKDKYENGVYSLTPMDCDYTVETWVMNENGEYQQTDSATVTAKYDAAVSVTPDDPAEGFELDAENSVLSATNNGNTVLKIYYARKQYTITWKVDGQNDVTTDVLHGATPAYPNGTPTKAETAEYTYTFAAWKDAEGTVHNAALPAATGEATYTATWTEDAKEYTLTINLGEHGTFASGTSKTDVTAEYGAKPEYPVINPKEGYQLKGWTVTIGETTQDADKLPEEMLATNATYTAKWERIPVEVKFQDGENVTTVSGSYFDEKNVPTPAAKEGHTFQGWAETAAANAEIKFQPGASITLNDTVKGKTYFAKWQINTFNVTYVNGESSKSETVDWNTEITVGALDDTTSHTFQGWLGSDGKTYVAGDKITIKGDLTLTAQWKINEYTITWKVEGKDDVTTTVNHGDTPVYNGSTPTKDEDAQYTYTFAGWTPAIVEATGDATYTATFTPVLRSYDITFVVDGVETKVSTKYGETPVYNTEGNDPEKATDAYYSYKFKGWATTEGGEVTGLEKVSDVATYYAVFGKTPVEHTITFVIAGEEGVFHQVKGGYGTDVDYSGMPSTEKPGYSLAWDKAETEWPKIIPAEDITITGTYTINQYTITFMDGETKIGEVTADYGAAITAPVVSKEGHKLTGWKDADGNIFSMTIPADNKTVYAQWEAESYDVTWEINGVTYATTSVVYGTAITAPNPAKDGYTFSGWSMFPEEMPAEPLTISGSWTPNNYTITFMNGDAEYAEITAAYESMITMPEEPTKEGCTFAGWLDVSGNPVNLITMPLNGMTVYANFTIDTFKVNFYASQDDTQVFASFDVLYGTKLLEITVDDPATEGDDSAPSLLEQLLNKINGKPEKEGHSWNKWDTSEVPETMPAANLNIYGTWNVNSYTITIMGYVNGVEMWALEHETFEYGAAVEMYGLNMRKDGYKNIKLTDTNNVDATLPATMPADNLVYRLWMEPITYTITFDVDSVEDITAPYETDIQCPADPTKEGHTFLGWSIDGTNVIPFPETMPLNGLNLKAVWQKNTVYIKWDTDGDGTVDQTDEYKYGDTINAPEATKATDNKWTYKFTGWDNEVPATALVNNTFTAQFAADQAVKYTVKFVNGNETVYETQVAWNGQVTLEGFNEPTLEGNNLTWTVDGKEATFPYEMTTSDVTFVANWTPITYTITADGVAYPFTYGTAVSIPEPTKDGHTFQGWLKDGVAYDLPETMPAENLVLTSNWNVCSYKVIFVDEENTVEKQANFGSNVLTAVGEITPVDKGTGYSFAGWFDANDVKLDWNYTMPAQNVTFTAKWTYTGWKTDEVGTTYLVNDEKAYFGVWETIDSAEYWFNESGYIVKDITLIDEGYYAFDHENGKFLSEYTGIYEDLNGDLYYVADGMAVENMGLYKHQFVDENSKIHTHYYYFGCDATGCTVESCKDVGQFRAQRNIRHWVENNNGMLVKGGYTFGDDGVIEHTDDTNRHGIQKIDGVKYYLMDGVKVHYGLFLDRGYYYYARSSGALVVNQNYWVSASKLNNLKLKAGSYKFDEEGRIVFGDKNGFYETDGIWYYYENGKICYKGLYWFDGKGTEFTEDWQPGPTADDPGYYYINSSGKLVTGCDYWISKNNGIMKNKTYTFDENGTMIASQVEQKNGFYYESGAWFYYENNVKTYAGLIWCDGPEGNDPGYYYVNSKFMLVTGCDYWISKNNGYMRNMTYTFGENGKMVTDAQAPGAPEEPEQPGDELTGHPLADHIRVAEDGTWYYYENDVKTYAGLILAEDGNYYYVNSSGKIIRNDDYWISKNNGYMKNRSYTFDANGVMTNPQPIA